MTLLGMPCPELIIGIGFVSLWNMRKKLEASVILPWDFKIQEVAVGTFFILRDGQETRWSRLRMT